MSTAIRTLALVAALGLAACMSAEHGLAEAQPADTTVEGFILRTMGPIFIATVDATTGDTAVETVSSSTPPTRGASPAIFPRSPSSTRGPSSAPGPMRW